MYFYRIFPDRRLTMRQSAKSAAHHSFHRTLLNKCFGKLSLRTFIDKSIVLLPNICWYKEDKYKVLFGNFYWLNLSKLGTIGLTLYFCWLFADSNLCTERSTKGAMSIERPILNLLMLNNTLKQYAFCKTVADFHTCS